MAVRTLLLGLLLVAPALAAYEYPLDGPEQSVIGKALSVQAVYEDTLADLGEHYGFGYLEMLAANPGLDPWLPGDGAHITLPAERILPEGPREGIVINLPEYRLYYYPPEGDRVITYPVGIGREGWSSPLGDTQVARKEANPSWYPPQSIRDEHAAKGDFLPTVVPPGPDNPMGPFKMNLAMGAYVIHGTNKKFGIGMRVSHGCFRMRNEDVAALFPLIPIGTPVRIVNQPYKLGLRNDELLIEVHTPLDEHGMPSTIDRQAAVQQLLAEEAERFIDLRLDWNRIRDAVFEESGMPTAIGQR
ncbi:L,D-transpeptidase family protein [Halopseudomonas pelagia]|uniref:L,D-transpeptidase family protein n=1 Tax=Halopseudomonas pelagia TaxID=553151 RepID=UPI0003A4158D|nr:L,D-transpeptidase family protein [Halopseudomonas pelagia]